MTVAGAAGSAGALRAVPIRRGLLVGLALVVAASTAWIGIDLGQGSSAAKGRVYGQLPLAFVPNAGQTDSRVRFSGHAAGASFSFTRKEAVFAFVKEKRGAVLRLAFLGANPRPQIAGQQKGPGRVNYLLGNDPERWHTNLSTYAQVVYRGLWPGIDLAFRGEEGKLTYELRVAPGASVSDIRLAYRGVSGIGLDRKGNLELRTPLGRLEDSHPIAYQELGDTRVPVESRYLLDAGRSSYGFTLGPYDPSLPLVIDPSLAYSTYLGGSDYEFGHGIAIDAAGNAYVTGITASSDFPTTAGAVDETFNGGVGATDAFVSKLNPSGSTLVYSTYLGGSGFDAGRAIAVDAAGNAYVTGRPSDGFPTTVGAYDTTLDGGSDAFVTKLDSAGSLVYSSFVGGSGFDEGHGIAVDGSGNAYVTGFAGGGFPTTAGAFDTTYNGGGDGFVTKLNATGSALVYSTYLGGNGPEAQFGGIAVNGSGNAYVTGDTSSANFPTTAGAFDTSLAGGDAFVTKLNGTGSALVYSTYLGGSGTEEGQGIALDSGGHAYVIGSASADFPTTARASDTTFGGSSDAFVTKLNATGSALAYSTFLGGSGSDGPSYGAIAVDRAGRAYVTGFTGSADFPTTATAFDTTANGGADAFVTKLNVTGSALAYSTYLGGSGSEAGRAIAVDGSGRAYVTGFTGSFDFSTTVGAFDTTANGTGDAFVAKLETGR